MKLELSAAPLTTDWQSADYGDPEWSRVKAQPLLQGSSIATQAGQPSRATLSFYLDYSPHSFIVGRSKLGGGALGGSSAFSLQGLDVVRVWGLTAGYVSPSPLAGQEVATALFTGLVIRISRQIGAEAGIPPGKARYTVEAIDGRWMLDRSYVTSLKFTDIGGTPGLLDTLTYLFGTSPQVVNDNTLAAMDVTGTSFWSNILDPLPTGLDDSWDDTTARKILDDLMRLTGAQMIVAPDGGLYFAHASEFQSLGWQQPWDIDLDEPDWSDSFPAMATAHDTDWSELATSVVVVATWGEPFAQDLTKYGQVDLVLSDPSLTTVTQGGERAQAELDARKDEKEAYAFTFYSEYLPGAPYLGSKLSPRNAFAGTVIRVTAAAMGLSNDLKLITSTRYEQVSDTRTRIRVQIGELPNAKLDLVRMRGEIRKLQREAS